MSSLLQQIKSLDTNKQNKLTAGNNISIDEFNVISSTSTSGGGITQEQLDAKQDLITTTTDISLNTRTTVGNLSLGGNLYAPNRLNFKARRGGTLTTGVNKCIIYDDVILNNGGKYIKYNGIYTDYDTTHYGTYFFYASFFTIPDVPYTVELWYFTDDRKRRAFARSSGVSTTEDMKHLSGTVYINSQVIEVKVQVVQGIVKTGDGTSNGSSQKQWSNFGGFLIG